MKIIKGILIFLAVIIIGVALMATLDKAMEAEQYSTCLKWQSWQKEGNKIFKPSVDQINICQEMGVELKRKKEIEI